MLLELSSIFITRISTYSGWTNKPTPRSDTARLISNVFKVLGNDDVFLSACIVIACEQQTHFRSREATTGNASAVRGLVLL